jgi:phage terminase large subunit-like protein
LYEQAFLEGEVVPELAHIVDENGEPVCRRKGSVFILWDTVPRMPWQTDDYYQEQMATLRPSDFLRLHRNQWITSAEEFIPVKYWDLASQQLEGPIQYQMDHPARQLPISVGVDAGTKSDSTAVVGCYYDYERGKVGLAFHRIWESPKGDERMDLSVIKDYILEMQRMCTISAVVYDPTQLHQVMTELHKKGVPVVEFTQTTTNMTAATQNLYDLIMSGNFEAYADDDLRKHIQFAAVDITGRGQRLVKQTKRSKNKIDAAVALAMAAFDAVERGGVDTSLPTVVESPFGDVSEFPSVDPIRERMEQALPPELRD